MGGHGSAMFEGDSSQCPFAETMDESALDESAQIQQRGQERIQGEAVEPDSEAYAAQQEAMRAQFRSIASMAVRASVERPPDAGGQTARQQPEARPLPTADTGRWKHTGGAPAKPDRPPAQATQPPEATTGPQRIPEQPAASTVDVATEPPTATAEQAYYEASEPSPPAVSQEAVTAETAAPAHRPAEDVHRRFNALQEHARLNIEPAEPATPPPSQTTPSVPTPRPVIHQAPRGIGSHDTITSYTAPDAGLDGPEPALSSPANFRQPETAEFVYDQDTAATTAGLAEIAGTAVESAAITEAVTETIASFNAEDGIAESTLVLEPTAGTTETVLLDISPDGAAVTMAVEARSEADQQTGELVTELPDLLAALSERIATQPYQPAETADTAAVQGALLAVELAVQKLHASLLEVDSDLPVYDSPTPTDTVSVEATREVPPPARQEALAAQAGDLAEALRQVYQLAGEQPNEEQLQQLVAKLVGEVAAAPADSAAGLQPLPTDRGTHERLMRLLDNIRSLRYASRNLQRFLGQFALGSLHRFGSDGQMAVTS